MIRLARNSDLPRILDIYKYAKEFMKSTGNVTQWNDKYPSKDLIKNDIINNQLFVYEEDDTIHGVFTFIIGEDITYKDIEHGTWISNELYGTIHRVASSRKIKGFFSKVIKHCEEKITHLRIDTHQDNKIMQHLITKNGFIKCGIIHVEDGTSRIAYEKIQH